MKLALSHNVATNEYTLFCIDPNVCNLIYAHLHTHVIKCVHIHIYIHICIHTYTVEKTYVRTCIHIRTYIHTYIHTHTHTYTYIHIHTHTYTYIHIHTHTYTYIHIHAHTYIHTCRQDSREPCHAFLHLHREENVSTSQSPCKGLLSWIPV